MTLNSKDKEMIKRLNTYMVHAIRKLPDGSYQVQTADVSPVDGELAKHLENLVVYGMNDVILLYYDKDAKVEDHWYFKEREKK